MSSSVVRFGPRGRRTTHRFRCRSRSTRESIPAKMLPVHTLTSSFGRATLQPYREFGFTTGAIVSVALARHRQVERQFRRLNLSVEFLVCIARDITHQLTLALSRGRSGAE